MKKNKKFTIRMIVSVVFMTVICPLQTLASSSMKALEESEMRAISGQGLILNDHISGTELAGSNEYSSPFDFYRMGLNGRLELNMNISKLQLGCGGINDHLTGFAGCDIDIDYASLMGRNGTNLGAPGSLFTLLRPYIEVAVKNDGTPTLREVAGIKIGAASADGAMSAGRRYTTNTTNQENIAYEPTCIPGRATNAAGCHSGINTVSGFLGSELSLTMDIRTRLVSLITVTATGCTGRTHDNGRDACGENLSDALFQDLAGTRMQTLGLQAAELKTNRLEIFGGSCGIFNPIACIAATVMDTVFASMNTDLRNVHKMTFEDTPDFFLSFQREPIAYPRYSKVTPNSELTGSEFDICNTGYATPRCNSAYSVPANTGWWLNAPNVKLLDVYNPNADLGNRGVDEAIALLGAPGLLLTDPEFNLTPAQNCHGSTRFC
ncbi:hypothetical protein [Alcanivorax sp. DP30]|uniref:hypothetical protein n=1 Tax=Alcanivorax sp. DP30 TaxID=2606217 RepID=UPI001370922A|nr:hypothetical protein [Alcanivorax sp. DP30]MZR63072.1 hypothetical protein [Alcanivorax sp. DP30]